MKRFFSWALTLGLACASPLAHGGEHCDSSFLGGGCSDVCSSCDAAGYATCECGAAVCDLGCGHSGLYAGIEATYLAPLYDEGDVGFAVVDPVANAAAVIDSGFDTAEELTGAPRVTLGYTGKRGFGIQARYWELENSSSEGGLPFGGAALQLVDSEDSFEAYTVDLELTKEFCYRGWDLFGTFGARHASIDHSRAASAVGFVNGDSFALGTRFSDQFNGTGLTGSLSTVRPFRRCRGLAFYANGRSSVVFGEADSYAGVSGTISGPTVTASTATDALAEDDEAMFIAEIGAGLQWSRCVRNFKGRMFARIGVEYQYWDSSNGESFAGQTIQNGANSEAVFFGEGSGDHEYHLIGLAAMTGFNW